MSTPMRTWLAIGAALLLAGVEGRGPASVRAVAAAAQDGAQRPDAAAQPAQPSQTPAQPVFRSGINFVRVDVIATDRNGNLAADLKPSEFEVLEDGKPQALEAFKLIKLDGGSLAVSAEPPRPIRTDDDERDEAARDDVRLFAVFLDDYHVREAASIAARAPLSRWVESQLGPADMIGVMHPLDPMSAVRMTRNHEAIARAIQQFRGRKGDYTPQNEFEARYQQASAEQVEQIRNQVSLSALKALIVHLGGLKEGRKALILVSEGYSNILPRQLRDPIAALPGVGNPDAFNPSAGVNDPNEARYAMFASQDLEFYLQGVYEVASQYNVAIYPVDPRGLPVFEFDADRPVAPEVDRQFLASTQDTLRSLAVETDGRAILNRNDLDAGMRQIIRDSSGYYLLGYSSTAKSDGKFHAITVRVKRPGIRVRARKGYWALTPEGAAVAEVATRRPSIAKPVEAALSSLAASNQPKSARLVRTWIGTSRGDRGKTRITVVWEPSPRPPGERSTPAAAARPERVAVTALAEDGAPLFRGRVPEGLVASAAPPAPGGAADPARPSQLAFDVRPGRMQLRLAVEGEGSQVLDTEVREIAVPDLTAAEVAIGTPQLFRARTPREYQQMKADARAVPSPARDFSRTERVFVRVPAYGPGASPPAVTARLLNRTGEAMRDLPVTAPAESDAPAELDLPLSALAPGEYILEITAGRGGEAGQARELVAFRVSS